MRWDGPGSDHVVISQLPQPLVHQLGQFFRVAITDEGGPIDHDQDPRALAQPIPRRLDLADHLPRRKFQVRSRPVRQRPVRWLDDRSRHSTLVAKAGRLKSVLDLRCLEVPKEYLRRLSLRRRHPWRVENGIGVVRRQRPLLWIDGDQRHGRLGVLAECLRITFRIALVVVPDLLLFHRHGGHIRQRVALIVRRLQVDEEV